MQNDQLHYKKEAKPSRESIMQNDQLHHKKEAKPPEKTKQVQARY